MNEEINDLLPSTEEVLMNEDMILKGMMEAANYRNDSDNQRKIQIKRNEKLLFEFVVRPLSEDEIFDCRKKATKYFPNPAGRHLPKIEGETDYALLRSYKILTATVDSNKIWNIPALKQKLNTLQPVDVVDSCLMAGEKDWICDIIDELSGYGAQGVSKEEYVKN